MSRRRKRPIVTGGDLSDGIESDLESDAVSSYSFSPLGFRDDRHRQRSGRRRPRSGSSSRRSNVASTQQHYEPSHIHTVSELDTIHDDDGTAENSDENSGIIKSLQNLFQDIPKIQWRLHPKVLLKLRKVYYPLAVTRLTFGVDYDLQSQSFDFKWSWKDRYLGARLSYEHNQIGLSRRFVIEKRTTFDTKLLFDPRSRKVLFKLDVLPFQGIFQQPKGFAVRQNVPLDKEGKTSMDIHARIQLPSTNIGTGATSALPFSFGEGEFVVDIEQLNFRLLLD